MDLTREPGYHAVVFGAGGCGAGTGVQHISYGHVPVRGAQSVLTLVQIDGRQVMQAAGNRIWVSRVTR